MVERGLMEIGSNGMIVLYVREVSETILGVLDFTQELFGVQHGKLF